MSKPETIKINDVEYVRKDSVCKSAEKLDGMDYVIIRTYSAGVHAGYLKSHPSGTTEVTLQKARRIWYWDGAATLSQMAVDGVSKPENCKFPCEVDEIQLTQAIEILSCTEKARKSIQGVKIWQN